MGIIANEPQKVAEEVVEEETAEENSVISMDGKINGVCLHMLTMADLVTSLALAPERLVEAAAERAWLDL